LTEFLIDNIGGPSLTTIKSTRAKKHRMQLGVDLATFVWLAVFYKETLMRLGIDLGSVLFQLSIDETVIMPTLVVSACGDFLLGSCGLKGTHEKPHVCAPIKISIRYGEEGYKDICDAVENYVLAHCESPHLLCSLCLCSMQVSGFCFCYWIPYADLTAVVVNPLVANVPPMPLMLAQGCNTFTSADAELQLKVLSDLSTEYLVPVLGPQIGLACGKPSFTTSM
jgi:hypothetical protein